MPETNFSDVRFAISSGASVEGVYSNIGLGGGVGNYNYLPTAALSASRAAEALGVTASQANIPAKGRGFICI